MRKGILVEARVSSARDDFVVRVELYVDDLLAVRAYDSDGGR